MLTTSLFSLAYLLKLDKEKKIELKGAILVGFIFLFFFCLDAIGSVIIYFNLKKKDVSLVSQ
jgi:hypothetical protein